MVSTTDEARIAAASGADAVVAQGAEAGGHRSSFTVGPGGRVPLVGTMALVRQVVRAVDVPVVAAGGIMDGAGLVAALALGAGGVQLGSLFLAARESGAIPSWKERLRTARDTDAQLTTAFSGRPARGLRNRLMDVLEGGAEPLGYPAQQAATADVRAAAARADEADLIALWAGQAAGLAGGERGAGEMVGDLVREAERVVEGLAALRAG
jgi:nitronate monooxygenase